MTSTTHLQLLFNDARMANLLDVLDELHTAASDGRLAEITTLNRQDMMGYLLEVVYTATETMAEMQRGMERGELADASDAPLRLVRKSEAS